MAAEGMEAVAIEAVVDFTGVVEASMVQVSAPEPIADTAIPMDTAATLTAMEDATWFGGE
jgi:hypothetical protein